VEELKQKYEQQVSGWEERGGLDTVMFLPKNVLFKL
jgi:hypothetical protein